MIRKNLKIITFLVIGMVALTGCWDYRDINKRSIVITVGVDRIGGEVEFATEVARLLGQSGAEAKAKEEDVYKDFSYGDNFELTRVDYDSRRPYPTFLSATRVVIFGNTYAREGIEPYINRINQTYDYRKNILTVVSREPAAELVKIPIEKDISVGFFIDNMMHFLDKKGTSLYPTVGEILSDIALGDVGYLLPYIGISQESIKYLGFAVMKDSKMIDTIDVSDSDGILYLLSDNPSFTEIIQLKRQKDNKYSFLVKIKDRKITTDYKNGKPVINIDLELKEHLQYLYYVEPISDSDMKLLENRISEVVKKYITEAVERSQKKNKCDIFGFARYFRADYPKIYKEMDWEEEYPKIDVNINVKSRIINTNLADPNAKHKY